MAGSLDYAGRLATAKKKRSWRLLWMSLGSIVVVCLVSWVWFWSRPYVAAHAIASARNPAEERVAFEYAHRKTSLYSVQFYDGAGVEIYPHLTGIYGPVKTIKVSWPNGATATVPLRDVNNLDILVLPD